MGDAILQKFKRLRDQRAIIDDGPHPRASVKTADRLSDELESWARDAKAGETLDRVCHAWLCPSWADSEAHFRGAWKDGNARYSTKPGPSMDLLETMLATCDEIGVVRNKHGELCVQLPRYIDSFYANPIKSGNLRLMIARACACLEARGIDRKETA